MQYPELFTSHSDSQPAYQVIGHSVFD